MNRIDTDGDENESIRDDSRGANVSGLSNHPLHLRSSGSSAVGFLPGVGTSDPGAGIRVDRLSGTSFFEDSTQGILSWGQMDAAAMISLLNMLSWKHRFLLVGGTLGLAIWLGYRAECRVMDSAGSKPLTFKSVVRRVMAPKSRTGQIDKLNRIRHGAGRTEPTPRETAEAWQIIRAMTLEDLKACLAEIPRTPLRPANQMLTSMLFNRWGQLDPEDAARTATQPPYEEDFLPIHAVATAWAERDPLGALRWAATLKPGTAQNTIGNSEGRMLVMQDPEKALRRVTAEFPYALQGVAAALALRADLTDEMRRDDLRALAALTDPRGLRTYLNQLRRGTTLQTLEQIEALAAVVEEAGIPEDLAKGFRGNLMAQTQIMSYTQIMERMLAPGSQTTPRDQQNTYSNWVSTEPDKALAWANQSGRMDLLAESVKSRSMSLLRTTWQPGGTSTSSPWVVKGIQSHYAAWRKQDAAAAETWLQTAPMDIRQHLSQDHGTR